jgi:putative colanic acid biosynthesis acetyltransferase WcaF
MTGRPIDPAAGPETTVPRPRDRIFLPQSLGERVLGALWAIVRVLLFRPTPESFNAWRVGLLKLFGARIGPHTAIGSSVRIDFPWNLRIGSDVFIAPHVIINCMGEVWIGDRTRISQYSHICAGTHEYQRRDMRIRRCAITIGSDVWVAVDAFVGPGVTLGDGCLLAARSSAFRDLPAGMVCIGEPARARKNREPGQAHVTSAG